jgi:alcohol dehydrogenase
VKWIWHPSFPMMKSGEKTGIFFYSMFPTISVVDSDLMMSVPPKFTAYQGMDAFYHAAESVINRNEHPMGEMFALKAIELVAANLPKAYKDGNDKDARANMALANTLAGYYMLCTSEHTMEHVMGSFHDNLVHGAGLIMISHAYFDFFAERKAAEEPMIRMAKAMGVENPTTGKDFIRALDSLIATVGCADLKMSEAGIRKEELKKFRRWCIKCSAEISLQIRFRFLMTIILKFTKNHTNKAIIWSER